MSKLLALSLAAPFILIGAAHPGPGHGPSPGDMAAATSGPVTYRACRPGRGDDRCIQLYERGVRASYAAWLRGQRDGERMAMGGPEEPGHAGARNRHAGHRAASSHAGHAAHHAAARSGHVPRQVTVVRVRERMARADHATDHRMAGHNAHRCQDLPREHAAPRHESPRHEMPRHEAPRGSGETRGM